MSIGSQSAVCALDDLGVLSFRGPDARRFLQGQLSGDVAALAPGVLLRAGLHNPQGRTLALLALLAPRPDELLALLPRELLAATLQTLRRYVLRAKLSIADETGAHRLLGIAPAAHAPADEATGIEVAYDAHRRLRVLGAGDADLRPGLARAHWRLLDIAAGLPQVYAPTSGQFVAQMLNLDCIGAISFDKGCYTGQEIIARAHYRGRVKRRMQRFISGAPLRLAPGDTGRLADGRDFRVIEAAVRPDGRVEFLAVAALPASGARPAAGADVPSAGSDAAPGSDATADTEAGALAGPAGTFVPAQALPLPYPLPE